MARNAFNSPGYRVGQWLIISGQTGRVGEGLVSEAFVPQFRQALNNVGRIVTDSGLELTDIAKVNIYLANMTDRDPMNEIYIDFFGQHRPARTTVGVNQLPRNALVEIEAWAYSG